MKLETILSRVSDQGPLTEPVVNVSGTWINQLSSQMTLAVSNGALSGTYTSSVSHTGEPVIGEIMGFVHGDLISIVVKWPSPALTAWVGQVVSTGSRDAIETLWQMTTNIPDDREPNGLWSTVFAGADRFTRKP